MTMNILCEAIIHLLKSSESFVVNQLYNNGTVAWQKYDKEMGSLFNNDKFI